MKRQELAQRLERRLESDPHAEIHAVAEIRGHGAAHLLQDVQREQENGTEYDCSRTTGKATREQYHIRGLLQPLE